MWKFRDHLKIFREHYGYSIQKLSVKTGIKEKFLLDYENGKMTPRVKTMKKIKDCFKEGECKNQEHYKSHHFCEDHSIYFCDVCDLFCDVCKIIKKIE